MQEKKLLNLIGWLGSLLFALCAVPQCIKAWNSNSMDDFSWIFLFMWFFGEIFSFIYVFGINLRTKNWQCPLLANYILNFLLLCYLIYVKVVY